MQQPQLLSIVLTPGRKNEVMAGQAESPLHSRVERAVQDNVVRSRGLDQLRELHARQHRGKGRAEASATGTCWRRQGLPQLQQQGWDGEPGHGLQPAGSREGSRGSAQAAMPSPGSAEKAGPIPAAGREERAISQPPP